MDPQKKAQSILKNIEDGKANEANLDYLTELLDIQPSIAPEIMQTLNHILQKGDVKACSSAILALDKIIENNPGLEDYSLKAIVDCMQKRKEDLHEDSILKILEILLRITQKYPERMGAAVPELLIYLKNGSIKVREKVYFLLALLAITHHEFFIGRSNDLIRVLNGLNLDERIKACRLIMKIAMKDRRIVADTYEVLEDLRLNHPDSILRAEAAFAIDKLKGTAVKKPSGIVSVKSVQKPQVGSLITYEEEDSFSDFANLVAPNEKDLKEALDSMGLNHLVDKKAVEKRDASRDLFDLISDSLDLSTAKAGKIELVIEKVPVQAAIDDIFNLIKEKAAKNNIVLKKGLDPALDLIEVDKQRFEQILFNLLCNSIKFSKTNGATITITTKREGDMARFSVIDTGIGIKEEDMGKLFKEFVQLDAGISRKYRGSGLGLAISKKLVDMHRGKIWAESKYGEGSTFTFLLPIQAKGQELSTTV